MRDAIEEKNKIGPKTHIITGEGKGKTTAALGMGMRAAGSGMRVVMIQFLKDTKSGELVTAEAIENFLILRFQKGCKGFMWQMNEEQLCELAKETETAFCHAETLMKTHGCDMLILDEVFACLSAGLVTEERLLGLVSRKTAELVLTGRDAPTALIDVADYVSDIGIVKHPFQEGLPQRRGIEY